MPATVWTVVTVRTPFSPSAQPVDFAGDWNAASAKADSLLRQGGFHQVWIVTTVDTSVDRGTARPLPIALTAKAKELRKFRDIKIRTLLSRAEGHHHRLFRLAAHRIDASHLSDQDLAAAFVDRDWSWDTICRAMS